MCARELLRRENLNEIITFTTPRQQQLYCVDTGEGNAYLRLGHVWVRHVANGHGAADVNGDNGHHDKHEVRKCQSRLELIRSRLELVLVGVRCVMRTTDINN